MRVATMVSAMIALCTAGTALAQDDKVWSQIAGWEIRIDATSGCFALATYETGTVMRIGYNADTDKVHLLFGDPEWKSLRAGKKYHMQFVFDGRETFEDDILGDDISGTVILSVDDVSDEFVKAFAERHSMEIVYQGKVISHLSLENTYAAINETMKCQQSLSKRQRPAQGEKDPFK